MTHREPYNSAFITVLSRGGSGLTVAVKDIIDVAGVITTAGCEYLAAQGIVASNDAACLQGFRLAGATLFGKTNLHELAFGTTGINSWSGTPVNPLSPHLIPGGSSSGSAVAVAIGACEVALGTDTGGSVRIPPACCGVAGLKTTYGQIPMQGVRPLAPSLDVVGPIARSVAGLKLGMELLATGTQGGNQPGKRVGRLRVGDLDPDVDAAVDLALRSAGLTVVACDIDEIEWEDAIATTNDILWAEAAISNISLRDHWRELQVGMNLAAGLRIAEDAKRMAALRRKMDQWRYRLEDAVGELGLVASPTLEVFPPTADEVQQHHIRLSRFTSPVNLSGLPAVVIPVPSGGRLPASLQLIGPSNSEDLLLATAGIVEQANA